MSNERILIVEDNVALEARPWEAVLKKQGYEVVGIAEAEDDAVKMALRERPSVVLMDIELADSKRQADRFAGLRAAQRIRANTGAQVIFVSGILAEPDVLSEAQKTPDFQFLMKPVTIEQLLASIQMALARIKRSSNENPKKKDMMFVSYSHKDIRFANEMMPLLRGVEGFGVSAWDDSQIKPSQRWETEIRRSLAEATAAICLVSPSFVDSKFFTEVELPAILRAEAERGLRVYPVYVNFVHEVILKSMGLLDFQGINHPDDPIAHWTPARRNRDCWGKLGKWLSMPMSEAVRD